MGEQVAAEVDNTAKALAQPAAQAAPMAAISDAQVLETADFIKKMEGPDQARALAAIRMQFGPEASKKILQALGMWQ